MIHKESDNMKKEIFSIPNLMGYFRILMLPVFVLLYNRAETPGEYAVSFVLLAVIFLSDALDGFVARKFNMVTNLGKMLDPIADKLVQGTLALAVALRHSFMGVFIVIFLMKEIYMGIMGLYLLKVKKTLNGAQWYGKVCTAVVDVGVLTLLFLPNMQAGISNAIITAMIAVCLFSGVMYVRFHVRILKDNRI